jgi:hypothetical protein
MSVDRLTLQNKSLKTAETLETEKFLAVNSSISGFKHLHSLIFKKLARRLLCLIPKPWTSGLKGFWSFWRIMRLVISIMQIKPAYFSTACQTECWN